MLGQNNGRVSLSFLRHPLIRRCNQTCEKKEAEDVSPLLPLACTLPQVLSQTT